MLFVRTAEHCSVRVADFGMDDEGDEGDDDCSGVYGTWEYLSPECWKRKYGEPCFASDVFSFGVILWEMWTSQREFPFRQPPVQLSYQASRAADASEPQTVLSYCRSGVYTGFDTIDPDIHWVIDKNTGKKSANVQLVAQRYAQDDERPQVRDGWACGPLPTLWSLLIQACWSRTATERPTFPQIECVLERMQSSEDWHICKPAAEPEPEAVEQTYDGWLAANEIDDKKDELYEWGVRQEDDPLGKLVEMLREETEEEDEDLQDMIEDIFEGDEAAQSDFRSAVVALAGASQEPEPEVGDAPTGNVAWQELCELLQVEDEDILQAGKAEDERLLRLRADLDTESIKGVEEMIKEKDEMLALMRERVGMDEDSMATVEALMAIAVQKER
eukprot:COSAG06_NODE_3318_length_5510_cov_54.390622_6_plen_387_part_01